MNRRTLPLFLLAVAWLNSAAFAQIVGPESLKPYEKIELVCQKQAAEGREIVYEWRADAATTWIEAVDGGRRLLAGAPPGPHSATCKVTVFNTKVVLVPDPDAPDDPSKFKRDTLRYSETLEIFDWSFKVEGTGPTPPPPDPDPDPTPGTLGALVPAEARAPLAEFYGDLAAVVKAGGFTSTSHFREGYRLAIKTAQDAGKFPVGVSAIDKPISDRITAAITLADAPLDAAKSAALVTALESIAADFRGS